MNSLHNKKKGNSCFSQIILSKMFSFHSSFTMTKKKIFNFRSHFSIILKHYEKLVHVYHLTHSRHPNMYFYLILFLMLLLLLPSFPFAKDKEIIISKMKNKYLLLMYLTAFGLFHFH